MDDFSWGNTRIVVGEGNSKKVMIDDDEKYDDSMIPMKRFSGSCSLLRFVDIDHADRAHS
jgi:hypothetical protein